MTSARPKHLWIFNAYALPPEHGGITRTHDLGKALHEHGWYTTIFSASTSYLTGREHALREGRLYDVTRYADGVRYVWVRTVPSYNGNDARRIMNMTSYLVTAPLVQRLFKHGPDLVLGSSPHPLAGLAGLITARARSVPFVYECRDLWPKALIDLGALDPKSRAASALTALEGYLFKHANKIVVLQEDAKEYVISHGIDRDAIAVIPNGSDIAASSPSASEAAAAASRLAQIRVWHADGDFVIVYAGAHGLPNGLETAIRAASQLVSRQPQVRFMFIGSGKLKEDLIRQAQAIGAVNVSFHDTLPKRSLFSVLREVDAGLVCFVGRTTGSPSKLADYMIAGLPIVYAGASSYDPVAQYGLGVSLPLASADGLTDAIERLVCLPGEVRREMGVRARQLGVRQHDIRVLALLLDDTLRGLVD